MALGGVSTRRAMPEQLGEVELVTVTGERHVSIGGGCFTGIVVVTVKVPEDHIVGNVPRIDARVAVVESVEEVVGRSEGGVELQRGRGAVTGELKGPTKATIAAANTAAMPGTTKPDRCIEGSP